MLHQEIPIPPPTESVLRHYVVLIFHDARTDVEIADRLLTLAFLGLGVGPDPRVTVASRSVCTFLHARAPRLADAVQLIRIVCAEGLS
jgi:hypothetical protein